MPTVLAFAPEVERVLALKTLRDADALAALHAAIRTAGRDEAEFSAERLHELTALEEHFQSLLLYDQVDFLAAGGGADADRDFANGVQRIHLEVANGLQRFLRNRASWTTDPEDVEGAARVAGLAVEAIHGLMKWGYFLGEPARTAPWRQLHTLFALADAEGWARKPFTLRASQPSFQPTVQSIYLRTLVLDMLNAGNLSRVQIEIADGWFAEWCREYALESEYVPGRHLFCLDLESAAGMRLIRGEPPGGAVRYLQAGALAAQIEEVRDSLRNGQPFAGWGAGAIFPIEEHVALLATIEKLHTSVLAGAESRIEERTHFEDREVDMVCGAERVMRKAREGAPRTRSQPVAAPSDLAQTIELSPAGLSVVPAPDDTPASAAAYEGDPEIERWRVHDLSSKGYGLIVDHSAADAIALNGLIALLNQETGGWIAATVVRKRPSRVRGEILVGVEVLAYRPIPVELEPAGGGPATPALYLPGADSSGKHDSLLVRAGQFDSGRVFAISTPEGEFRLRMNRIIRKGADWINGRFEIESKKA
jgi:hypothetical protein